MTDKTWGAIAWWVATILKWVVLVFLGLLVLTGISIYFGGHGIPLR